VDHRTLTHHIGAVGDIERQFYILLDQQPLRPIVEVMAPLVNVNW
jgi:hypothetical protein